MRKLLLHSDLIGLLWMLESPRVCFHLMLNLIQAKSWDGVARSLIVVMAARMTMLQHGGVREGIAHGTDATGDDVERHRRVVVVGEDYLVVIVLCRWLATE